MSNLTACSARQIILSTCSTAKVQQFLKLPNENNIFLKALSTKPVRGIILTADNVDKNSKATSSCIQVPGLKESSVIGASYYGTVIYKLQ